MAVLRQSWGDASMMDRARRRRHRLVATALLAVIVIACGPSQRPPPSRSTISTGPDGLRTFTATREEGGSLVSCGLVNVEPHVAGLLAGDAASPDDPIWLVRGGRRLSVVWPGGFSVRFEPRAVLYNDRGERVAAEGEMTELTQVSPDAAAGTFDDPYIASCWLFGEVYVYRP
jgi:hypothetical protein